MTACGVCGEPSRTFYCRECREVRYLDHRDYGPSDG